MKKIWILLTITVILLFVSSECRKEETVIDPEIASSDEALFKMGEQHLKKDPEKARLYLRQVIDSFPKSFYAQRAKLAIADSYFNQGDEGSMIIAASEYREFISLYPYSPSAAYAQYQIAMTYYEKVLKPGRDQTKTKQALEEFKKVVTNYPLSEEAEMAEEKIKDCEERLGQHYLSIAELYYKMGALKAAISRLLEIISDYPNFSEMDKVYYYLGDSYYKGKNNEQALPYLTKLVSDYPNSKYADDAQELIKKIESQKSG
ncbi:MAG: outer membrane protein assembly factor BamD [Acidobacteriota bacterium]